MADDYINDFMNDPIYPLDAFTDWEGAVVDEFDASRLEEEEPGVEDVLDSGMANVSGLEPRVPQDEDYLPEIGDGAVFHAPYHSQYRAVQSPFVGMGAEHYDDFHAPFHAAQAPFVGDGSVFHAPYPAQYRALQSPFVGDGAVFHAPYHSQYRAVQSPFVGATRFSRLAGELERRGAYDPAALAAWIGRRKYGADEFARLSALGRMRAARRRRAGF